ncbi:hypothetical protein FOBRF1_005844 [Fusarium oxysporum]
MCMLPNSLTWHTFHQHNGSFYLLQTEFDFATSEVQLAKRSNQRLVYVDHQLRCKAAKLLGKQDAGWSVLSARVTSFHVP